MVLLSTDHTTTGVRIKIKIKKGTMTCEGPKKAHFFGAAKNIFMKNVGSPHSTPC